MKRERGFLILKGDFERKSVKENAPRERMLASGLGVYRFVMIGQISRQQHQLVRPSPPQSGGGRDGSIS